MQLHVLWPKLIGLPQWHLPAVLRKYAAITNVVIPLWVYLVSSMFILWIFAVLLLQRQLSFLSSSCGVLCSSSGTWQEMACLH